MAGVLLMKLPLLEEDGVVLSDLNTFRNIQIALERELVLAAIIFQKPSAG